MSTKNIASKGLAKRFRLVPAPTPAQLRHIDRKHAIPKIRYFRQEPRYAFPANMGNARNPLVFGKIPKAYAEREKKENLLSLQLQANKAHNWKVGTR